MLILLDTPTHLSAGARVHASCELTSPANRSSPRTVVAERRADSTCRSGRVLAPLPTFENDLRYPAVASWQGRRRRQLDAGTAEQVNLQSTITSRKH